MRWDLLVRGIPRFWTARRWWLVWLGMTGKGFRVLLAFGELGLLGAYREIGVPGKSGELGEKLFLKEFAWRGEDDWGSDDGDWREL